MREELSGLILSQINLYTLLWLLLIYALCLCRQCFCTYTSLMCLLMPLLMLLILLQADIHDLISSSCGNISVVSTLNNGTDEGALVLEQPRLLLLKPVEGVLPRHYMLRG